MCALWIVMIRFTASLHLCIPKKKKNPLPLPRGVPNPGWIIFKISPPLFFCHQVIADLGQLCRAFKEKDIQWWFPIASLCI